MNPFRLLRGDDDILGLTSSVIDEMAIVLAHELNQPLTALILYLRALERLSLQAPSGAALPELAVALLEKALHEAERAGDIIDHMRRFLKEGEPVREFVDLNLLVDDAVELTVLASRRNAHVVCALAPDLPSVPVDPVQVQQIVVNLVRNALDAMNGQTRPKVHIRTRRTGDRVALAVEDSGPGIPADVAPHIFQALSSSKRSGLGLGLAISKAIARNHGGDLTFDPGGHGKGAVFTLHLPISVPVVAPPLVAS
jgi:two-component system, LuxR family, sensor kinase FixL